ncbi:hypothetical protein J7T55_008227 [Diaporthe amygdali]|uniref:uncharacterized protein n=1 Tax=Phomopsis amygdali TaxID=1214568 RepID=UPI0022FEBD48|nr:uncharacterized protein J7T55_008227 [Diaporthe amygdali]KAJ0121067.1 hypothetical protein J7T55_008227 [Diaporthe amygdali]
MESKRLQTAKKYISHFETLDTDTLASVLAPDHTHQFAPASLVVPGPFTKEQFLAHSAALRKIMTGFPVYAKEYVESESSNQVTVWATSRAHFKEEVLADEQGDEEERRKKWEFEGEYVFMFWMDETGEKVVRTVEFLDSNLTENKLRPLLKRANEKVQSRNWF